jgi:hypothetical protein
VRQGDETDAQQLMYRGKGAVWNQRYTNAKTRRDLISQMISRINKKFSFASPPVPIAFSLRRGYDCVNREDLTPPADGTSPGFDR